MEKGPGSTPLQNSTSMYFRLSFTFTCKVRGKMLELLACWRWYLVFNIVYTQFVGACGLQGKGGTGISKVVVVVACYDMYLYLLSVILLGWFEQLDCPPAVPTLSK